MGGKIIGILSIKGGVGKTSCTANLGAAIAHDYGKKVLVVDANFSAPNLGFHLGLLEPDLTIHDVLKDKAEAKDAVYEFSNNLHVIPASLISHKVQPFKLKKKIGSLKSDYDVIIIDSSPNLNDEMLATMIASDELYVVTSPDYPTLSTTMRAVKLAKDRKTHINGLILNRVHGKKFELTLKEIEDAAGVPVIGVLPEDLKVLESIASTTPVSLHSPRAKSAVEFKKLAAHLVGEEFDDPRFLARVIKMFKFSKKKEIPQEEINKLLLKEEDL